MSERVRGFWHRARSIARAVFVTEVSWTDCCFDCGEAIAEEHRGRYVHCPPCFAVNNSGAV